MTKSRFEEDELFMLAGYLSSGAPIRAESHKGLDPYVAKMLARESMETQRAIIGILSLLKSLAHSTGENSHPVVCSLLSTEHH